MYKAVRMFNYKDGLGLEQEALKGVCEVEEHVCSTEDDVIKYCQDADAVMGIFEPLTARVINSLPKLKLIACKSMGYNYVDLEAAKARGISVTHLRSAFSIDVADYVTACILAHNKRLFAYDRSVRRDKKWDYSVCQRGDRWSGGLRPDRPPGGQEPIRLRCAHSGGRPLY